MSVQAFICGADEPLRARPCLQSGPDHAAWPSGYGSGWEYACQLLATGWRNTRCPACLLFGAWTPPEPMPQPPMLPCLDWDGPCGNCDHHHTEACPETYDRSGPCDCPTWIPSETVWGIPAELEDTPA